MGGVWCCCSPGTVVFQQPAPTADAATEAESERLGLRLILKMQAGRHRGSSKKETGSADDGDVEGMPLIAPGAAGIIQRHGDTNTIFGVERESDECGRMSQACGLLTLLVAVPLFLFSPLRETGDITEGGLLQQSADLPGAPVPGPWGSTSRSPAFGKDAYKYVSPVVDQQATSVDQAHTTYRLSLKLGPKARNVYTIYGAADSREFMRFPPAFQVAAPFGVGVGGVNEAFLSLKDAPQQARFDSWITVGVTNGIWEGVLGIIGIDLTQWDESNPLVVNDGALFYMDPHRGPRTKTVVVAQLTVTTSYTGKATMSVGGRSMGTQETPDFHCRAIFKISP